MALKTSGMRVEKDFVALLKLFNKHKVKYCIIGGFAYGFHAQSRYTKDIDLLVEASVENGERIVEAVKDFGFGDLGLSPSDFARPKQVIQIGQEPVRIDLLTSVSGTTFRKIWKNRKRGQYGDLQVPFIGLEELIKTKKAVGRLQDKADLEMLDYVKKRKSR